jgi:hypothetical protein
VLLDIKCRCFVRTTYCHLIPSTQLVASSTGGGYDKMERIRAHRVGKSSITAAPDQIYLRRDLDGSIERKKWIRSSNEEGTLPVLNRRYSSYHLEYRTCLSIRSFLHNFCWRAASHRRSKLRRHLLLPEHSIVSCRL